MKEKKNIDRLFQERFKNFEEQPSDQVWANIAAAQKTKGDRKIIPLWWKVGGIAAALAILLGLGNFISETTTPTTNTKIVDQGTQEEVVNENNTKNTLKNTNPEAVVTSSKEAIQGEQAPSVNTSKEAVDQKNIKNSLKNINEQAVLTSIGTPPIQTDNVALNKQKSNVLGNYSTTSKLQSTTATTSGITATSSTSKTSPSIQNTQTPPAGSTTSQTINNQERIASSLHTDTTTNESSVSGNNPRTKVTKNTAPITVQEETAIAVHTKETTEEALKKDLVAEAKKIEEEVNKDEAIAQLDDTPSRDRWDVGAIAAPVYYSDFGGSGLDDRFADNDKSGDVNLSYGVQVSYAVTPKFKIRTGVSNLDLSYNTNEIQFSTNGLGRRVQGLDYSDNAKTLAISDNSNPRENNAPVDNFSPIDFDNKENGALVQQLSYVEVPVEAVYVLSDRRLGVSVVGGLSTLFLNNNEVILESATATTSLGTATGANDLSFTTNFGVGIDYKMTDKLKLNIEPSIKYQLNSFDESVGDFKPYFLGVYTGINYKF